MSSTTTTTSYKDLPEGKSKKAKFFNPPNRLKQKVGSGGLPKNIIEKAQEIIDRNNADFRLVADPYLAQLTGAMQSLSEGSDKMSNREKCETLILPVMQMKANGSTFKYPVITEIADLLVHFLEKIDAPDGPALEIVKAFYASIQYVLSHEMKGSTDPKAKVMIAELEGVVSRYFEKYPKNIDPETAQIRQLK